MLKTHCRKVFVIESALTLCSWASATQRAQVRLRAALPCMGELRWGDSRSTWKLSMCVSARLLWLCSATLAEFEKWVSELGSLICFTFGFCYQKLIPAYLVWQCLCLCNKSDKMFRFLSLCAQGTPALVVSLKFHCLWPSPPPPRRPPTHLPQI